MAKKTKNTHCEITVLDPERWYLKFTEKRKHYIQMHASFWIDNSFLSLSFGAKVLFLWILSQCLRVNKPILSVCLDSAYVSLRCSLDEVKGFLSEIERSNIIVLSNGVRRQYKEENKRKENRIKEKAFSRKSDLKTVNEKTYSNKPQDFDFELIYSFYPRKAGKALGLKKLKSIITNQELYDAVLQGSKTYAKYCAGQKTDNQYIAQFSTWVNGERWNDELKVKRTAEELDAELLKIISTPI